VVETVGKWTYRKISYGLDNIMLEHPRDLVSHLEEQGKHLVELSTNNGLPSFLKTGVFISVWGREIWYI